MSKEKKDVILTEDGKRYAVYYNQDGKRILTEWMTYSASGELTPSKTVEEIMCEVVDDYDYKRDRICDYIKSVVGEDADIEQFACFLWFFSYVKMKVTFSW